MRTTKAGPHPGWRRPRLLGRTAGSRGRGNLGYDHFEVVVDDGTRLAYVAHVPHESATSTSRALLDAAVWFAEHGVRIERVMTDNAWAYTSSTPERTVASLDAVHKRTRPYRPQTNGASEFGRPPLRRRRRDPCHHSRRARRATEPYAWRGRERPAAAFTARQRERAAS